MNVQLTLIESREAPVDWKIDEETRSIGREGLRSAREALANARTALETPIQTDTDSDEIELPAAA